MSKNVKVSAPTAVPFFARFLAEQAVEANNSNSAPYGNTMKYPSDWEDWQRHRPPDINKVAPTTNRKYPGDWEDF